MDGNLAAGGNIQRQMLEILRGPVGIRTVPENLHLPGSRRQETQVQFHLPGVPVRQGTDVPDLSLAAGDGDMAADFSVESDRLVPDRRDLGDELRALRLAEIIGRAVA